MNSGGYSLLKKKKETISSTLQEISILISELGLSTDSVDLARQAKDIQQGIFKVLVLGKFRNGKSTLLQALLGSKTLLGEVNPNTIITELVYGNRKDVAIYKVDQENPCIVTREAFIKLFQLTREDFESFYKQGYIDKLQNIEYAQMECQQPLCASGVKLIDCPGLTGDTPGLSRDRVLLKVVKSLVEQPQLGAVVFLLNALQILSEEEQEFIETQLGTDRLDNVFFVVNHINWLDEDDIDEIKSWFRTKIQRHFLDENGEFDQDFYNRRVFYVNAKDALDARSATPSDNVMLEASGVPALERKLEQFLTSDEKIKATFEPAVRSLANVVEKANNKIAQEKFSITQQLGELEKRREEVERELRDLKGKKSSIERTILLFGEAIKPKIYANLRNYIDEMPETWLQDFKLSEVSQSDVLMSLVSGEARERIAAVIAREAQNYFQVKFDEWAQRVPTFIQEEVNKMDSEISEIEARLGLRIADLLGGWDVLELTTHRPKGAVILQIAQETFCFIAPAFTDLLCSGLTVAPQTDTASPAAKTFTAALVSLS